MIADGVLVDVAGLRMHFPVRRGVVRRPVAWVRAVDDVSFAIHEGSTLGLVGESGCGKTTLARTILRLVEPTSGRILFRRAGVGGEACVDVTRASAKLMKSLRKDMQIIFQDPFSSLNPRMSAGAIISAPLAVHRMARGSEREARVRDVLSAVGLTAGHMRRYPHEFSGGQRQRIGIARALVLDPRFVVCDEPVSALDVSIQAQVLNLLEDLRRDFGLTYLFITHDLSVVRHISDRVAVMYLGKIVEMAQTEALFGHPRHPYSEALMSAVPVLDPDRRANRIVLHGDVPSPVNPPPGCSFHPRCRYAASICETELPAIRGLGDEHYVSCHRAEGLELQSARST